MVASGQGGRSQITSPEPRKSRQEWNGNAEMVCVWWCLWMDARVPYQFLRGGQ